MNWIYHFPTLKSSGRVTFIGELKPFDFQNTYYLNEIYNNGL
jgi:hypothetical protein